jgi:glycosyltransferase involved in cell wall biosynthesis
MHVLMTADTLGGVWTYARELATSLVRRGVRVTLVSFGEIPTVEQVRWMEELGKLDFRPTGFRLEWMQGSEDDLAAATEYLRMIIPEVKPDVLHFNQFYFGAMDTAQPKIVVAHSDVVSWWEAVHHRDPDASEWLGWYQQIVRRGLQAADAVIAPSQAALDSTIDNFVRPRKAQVIANGRSPELFNPHQRKESYAASIGRIWDAGKNASLLTRIETPWPIYLAGNNINPDARVQATSLNLGEGRLVFKGVQSESELRRLFAGASLYIATSQYEPFGLAPVEAAMSRCAILASDIPSFREIWEDGALYFRSNDPEDLERTLFDVCARTDVLREYGDRALRRARTLYTSSKMADEYFALYRSLVSAKVAVA